MNRRTTRPGNATERVMSQLRQAIQDHQFAPGQRLIEADLMRTFEATRGPMREAVRRLASEGVIELIPNRGAVVRQFSRQEMVNLFRIREVIEGLAARQATESMAQSPRYVHFKQTLQAIANRREQEGMSFSKENLEFHELIVHHADNPHLTQLIGQLQLPLLRFQMRAFVDDSYREQSRLEHELIGQAILSQDSDAAEQMMRNHLKQACERFLSHL